MAEAEQLEIKDPTAIERFVGRRFRDGIIGYLDIVVDRLDGGTIEAHFDVRDDLLTGFGNMHGGCLAAFCDHTLAILLYPVMEPGYWAATSEFKINYLHPVRGGVCSSTGKIVHMSHHLAVVHVDIENEGRLVATAQGTLAIMAPHHPAPGRG